MVPAHPRVTDAEAAARAEEDARKQGEPASAGLDGIGDAAEVAVAAVDVGSIVWDAAGAVAEGIGGVLGGIGDALGSL